MSLDTTFQIFNLEEQRREARRVRVEAERQVAELQANARQERENVRAEGARTQASIAATIGGAAGIESAGLASEEFLEEQIREENRIILATRERSQTIRRNARRQEKAIKRQRALNIGLISAGLVGGVIGGVSAYKGAKAQAQTGGFFALRNINNSRPQRKIGGSL